MADYLNRLPSETLGDIVEFVGPDVDYLGDLAALARCSKRLHTLIEPKLYQSELSRVQAMRWGCCNDSAATIRLAVSYGAPVSTVREWYSNPNFHRCNCPPEVHGPGGPDGSHGEWMMRPTDESHSTLLLASESSSVEAFKCLIRLGAVVDDVSRERNRTDRLLNRICVPKAHSLLQDLVEYGNPLQFGGSGVKLLTASVYYGATEGTVRMMLDKGAALDESRSLPITGAKEKKGLHASKRRLLLSPLSAAVMAGSEPVFDLLISRGADINKDSAKQGSQMPWHVPFYAAAAAMALHGSTKMMQRCIGNGARVQHLYDVRNFQPTFQAVRRNVNGVYITPLLAYLESIKTWDGSLDLKPRDGIEYILGLLTRHAEPGISRTARKTTTIEHDVYGIWTAFWKLLFTRGIAMLEVDNFFLAMELLASKIQGHSGQEVSNLSAELFADAGTKADLGTHVAERWATIVGVITDAMRPEDKDAMLWWASREIMNPRWLIRNLGLKRRTLPVGELSSLELCNLDKVLASAADVPSHPFLSGTATVLRSLCDMALNILQDLQRKPLIKSRPRQLARLERVERFAKIMIARGADPTVLIEEGTLIEALWMWKAAMGLEESREDSLSRLLAALTGVNPDDVADQFSNASERLRKAQESDR